MTPFLGAGAGQAIEVGSSEPLLTSPTLLTLLSL